MAKSSPAKLFIFFFFFFSASVHILENLSPISAIVDHIIPQNSSYTYADPCQNGPWKHVKTEVGIVEHSCDESDMTSFANAFTCTRDFLWDQKPYDAASFVYKFHRHNAGKTGFLTDALLDELDLTPSLECRGKGDREMVPEYYHRGLDLLLEELDQYGIFDERKFDDEDFGDDHDGGNDDVDDDHDDDHYGGNDDVDDDGHGVNDDDELSDEEPESHYLD